jgi:SAM-dependent methyltransferase
VPAEREIVQAEFERTAATFAARTAGRFDHMDVVAFSTVEPGATVLEVGAGTGNFLALFDAVAGVQIALDLTAGMLAHARARNPAMELVQADGAALPIRSRSIDLACSAQVLHHIHRPIPVLKEMRRVVGEEGRVLIVDQVAPERVEEMLAMNELEILRDPSHAASRAPSGLRIMVGAAGLDIEAEEVHESTDRLSTWMSPQEFPADRIAAVQRFVAERGAETGMAFERDGDDWVYTRRRIQILAHRAA